MAYSDQIPEPPQWADWRNGDWGMLGSDDGQGYYESLNCHVYEDGALGTRPGWRTLEHELGDLKPRAVVWRDPGSAGSLGYIHLVTDDDMLRLLPVGISEGKLALGTVAGPVPFAITAGPNYADPVPFWDAGAAPRRPLHVASEAGGQLVTVNGTIHRTALTGGGLPDTGTVPVDGDDDAIGVTVAELYGIRMYACGNATFPTRVYYSEESDFSTWENSEDVLNLFTRFLPGVGNSVDAASIVALKQVRNVYCLGP